MRKLFRSIFGFVPGIFRLLLATWRRTRASDVQLLAGSLAFATVLSIVPLLAVSFSVFKAYGGLRILMKQIEPFILENFVDASGVHVSNFVTSSIARIQSGVLGVTGSIALFFSSTKLLLDMETAVRRIWQETLRRLSFRRLFIYWIFMFVGPMLMAVAIGIVGSKDIGHIKMIPRHTLAFAFTFIGVFCINWYVPSKKVRLRSAIISGLLTACGIALAQQFFAQVTKSVLRYSKIYGSFASIPIFLLWILLLWWIFFAGVALCATLEEGQIGDRRIKKNLSRNATN